MRECKRCTNTQLTCYEQAESALCYYIANHHQLMSESTFQIEKYVTAEEISELTGIGLWKIRELAKKRLIPTTRVGHKTVMYRPSKVQEALDKIDIPNTTAHPKKAA